MNSSGIQVSDVHYTPPAAQASTLKGVTFGLQMGEFIAVLGHNGSGKSTLARHLNGLLKPTRGCVIVDGLSTSAPESLPSVRRRVGMIFQNPDHQIVGTSVAEDVLWGMPAQISRSEMWARMEEALVSVGLEGYENQATWRLSGGQKQRLALAGVLARDPQYLICDEPTALLDGRSRKEATDLLLRCRDRGMGLLWITHRMEEALLADRLLVLRHGAILTQGRPEELLAEHPEIFPSVPPLVQAARGLRLRGVQVNPMPRSVRQFASELTVLLDRGRAPTRDANPADGPSG